MAHPHFAFAVVVIPAIIHKVDAAVDGRADDADRHFLVGRDADMITAETDGRDALTGSSELSVDDIQTKYAKDVLNIV